MELDRIIVGNKGEDIAAEYLINEGYEILARNWRWKRAEVDIIARKNNCLIMAEVKTRTYTYFGTPDNFVTNQKEKMLLEAGYQYAEEINHEWTVQVDIIAIVLKEDGGHTLQHFEDVYFPAFE